MVEIVDALVEEMEGRGEGGDLISANRARALTVGRPEATSHAEIEKAAFRLFAQRGFEATTLDSIASEVGVSRRTLFRYYPSKNDIPWGNFDATLSEFRDTLRSMPAELPLHEAVHRGVLAFNAFPEEADPPHIERMRLILRTPALQAHSVIRYAQWRGVIAEYVAERGGLGRTEVLPQMVGHMSLALALTAYEQWLQHPDEPLRRFLDQAMGSLVGYIRA